MAREYTCGNLGGITLSLFLGCVLFCLAMCCPPLALAVENTVVVSLGDSYSSGEGNAPYFGQDSKNKYENEDWLAHRSTNSWPSRLVVDGVELKDCNCSQQTGGDDGAVQWFFYASSGAVAKNIYDNATVKTSEKEGPWSGKRGAQSKTSRENLVGQEHNWTIDVQLDAAQKGLKRSKVSPSEVDYVTITIGGNDVGFEKVITELALRNGIVDRDYLKNALNVSWYNFDGRTQYQDLERNLIPSMQKAKEGSRARDDIRTCYSQIRKQFPNAEILVAGYPTLLDDSVYDKYLERKNSESLLSRILSFSPALDIALNPSNIVGFSDWEAWLLNDNVKQFNDCLEAVVNETGDDRIRFISVEDEFDGKEAEFLYGIMPPKIQDLEIGPSTGSMHPNGKGLEAYKNAVQREIKPGSHIGGTDHVGEGAPESERAVSSATSQASTVGKRDVALVLDVSGSMAGNPLEETKRASERFVNVAFDNDTHVGLVAYDDEAENLAGFGSSKRELNEAITSLKDGGGTNIESGIAAARNLFESSDAGRHYLVLMSDGEPNDGKVGDELISYAQELKDPDNDGRDDSIVYSLGFNETAEGQSLLRAIASNGCFYSVRSEDDLQAFFQDIADSINGVRFFYLRIACPVDVSVSQNGETLSSSGGIMSTRTSFGSLTFEESGEEPGGDPVKVLRLREGASYEIAIEGTGSGEMDYSIGFVDDEGRYSDVRTFSSIAISNTTKISTVAEASDQTTLSVDDDGDGSVDRVYRAGANEEGELVDNSWFLMSIVAVMAVAVVTIVALFLWFRLRKSKLWRPRS